MCGIVGVLNGGSVTNTLIRGLQTLEYRGYDSAGIATISPNGLDRRRAQGKLSNLEGLLESEPLDGPVGIGHTRWATHGGPAIENAHPHFAGGVAVVHNGIIENHQVLRTELQAKGAVIDGETDSEIIPWLIASLKSDGVAPLTATQMAVDRLEGQYAIAAIFESHPDMIIAARKGSPLCVGLSLDGGYIASDELALPDSATTVVYLEDGDVAVILRNDVRVFDKQSHKVSRKRHPVSASAAKVSRFGHRHFMHKEIMEQPKTVAATAKLYEAGNGYRIENLASIFANCARLSVVACGTSYYAGLVARDWFENIAGIACDLETASEFRHRRVSPDTAVLFISQSGETADTLACLRHVKNLGQPTVSIVNVPSSTMAREADMTILTNAGPEIGVASTKAFTAQLVSLLLLARTIGELNGHANIELTRDVDASVTQLPGFVEHALAAETSIQSVATHLAQSSSALFLGRGANYGLALEGALKLKEISYIHAEGIAAGEIKHGPIALIDETMPAIFIAPIDRTYRKIKSSISEVAARGGQVILISDARGNAELAPLCAHMIELPDCPEILQPIMYATALQLLAYHTAVALGCDVDQPRNLAKSVTVE